MRLRRERDGKSKERFSERTSSNGERGKLRRMEEKKKNREETRSFLGCIFFLSFLNQWVVLKRDVFVGN